MAFDAPSSAESDVEVRVWYSMPQRIVSQFLSHSSSSAGGRWHRVPAARDGHQPPRHL